jgi:hypothetical protein
MYSAAKAKLEQEQANVVPPQIVTQTLKPEDLTEKAKVINEILEKLSPIAEAKLKAARNEAALEKAVVSLGAAISQILTDVEDVKAGLSELVKVKNANAELERQVLEKLSSYM